MSGDNKVFPEKITPHYRSLFTAISDDPLKRMVCYSPEEENSVAGESDDPLGESLLVQGRVIHRYANRVLLLVTDRCAAHCRFCFRKSRKMPRGDITTAEVRQVVEYLRCNKEVEEVIFSGGDPLSLSNQRLEEIITAIKEVREGITIRIHTRYPVYDPSRCVGLEPLGKIVPVFVLHINHPRELAPALKRALPPLTRHSLFFSQTVLLKGVNDSAATLALLSRELLAVGVIPYYLHLLDRARGTSPFLVTYKEAAKIVDDLSQLVAGYLVPRLVVDDAKAGKRRKLFHLEME